MYSTSCSILSSLTLLFRHYLSPSPAQDGLISRDELLLMLNQVPRTLLSIGGADASDTFPAHTIGGDARGTPRRARTLSHSRAGDESIPRHVPASLGRKRRVSVEPVVGGARKTGRPVVNPAFTNESIADQALQEFGAGTVSRRCFWRK